MHKKNLAKIIAAIVIPGAVPLIIAYYAYKIIKYKDNKRD